VSLALVNSEKLVAHARIAGIDPALIIASTHYDYVWATDAKVGRLLVGRHRVPGQQFTSHKLIDRHPLS
jgi:hypothetical protein